ncbi:MAG: 50S ribosomal protein L32 [Bacillota bacterium]|nr:50S ribosomal protein L32 [Bacillota bacterium]
MANPKRRTSRARKNARRTHWKLEIPQLGSCPQCHEPKLPHRVCAHCGFYDGRPVLKVEEAK